MRKTSTAAPPAACKDNGAPLSSIDGCDELSSGTNTTAKRRSGPKNFHKNPAGTKTMVANLCHEWGANASGRLLQAVLRRSVQLFTASA